MVPGWYSDLRDNLSRIMITSLQDEDKKLQNKSMPIGRKVATVLGNELIKRNTKEGVFLSNVNTNCLLNGGRTGEIVLASHNLMDFCFEEGG